MRKIISLAVLALSIGITSLTTQTTANAAKRYNSAPSITRGDWTIKWGDGLFNSSGVQIYSKSVKIKKHSYKFSYVKKTSKNHFTFYLKNGQHMKVAYKTRVVGNRKDVKTIGITIGTPPTGYSYDGLFYKGYLQRYPYKDTNFITLDNDYDNGLPFDYIIITGKTLPGATVNFSNGGSAIARKDGKFTIRINRQGKLMMGNTVTVSSSRKSAATVSKDLSVTTDPDGGDYDQSDYDSNGTLDYTPDYF
ncbi:hypothetical protein [Levilactobacillus brevis]